MKKPTAIERLIKKNALRLSYGKESFILPAELLRTHSPSAEVRQHGNPILVTGKAHVVLTKVEPIGLYGIKLTFDDGHDSGIFTWSYLSELCAHQAERWDRYLAALHKEGKSRFPDQQVVQIQPPKT